MRPHQTSRRAATGHTRLVLPKHGDRLVRQYVDAALADNTIRAYRGDLNHFFAWGGTIPATERQVAKYLAQHATTLAGSTLARHLAALTRAHRVQGFPSPCDSELVHATLRGIRRAHGRAIRQVAPLLKEHLVAMVRGLKGMRGMRDRALLLIGFSGALRRAELVELDVEDIHFTESGVLLHLVDASQEDVVDAWRTVRAELEAYDEALGEKPEIVALSKCELLPEDELAAKVKKLKRAAKTTPILLSAVTGTGVEAVLRAMASAVEASRAENDESRAATATRIWQPIYRDRDDDRDDDDDDY